MDLAYKLTNIEVNSEAMKKMLESILQVAAQRGWEEMVERLPARNETPYSTGRLRESIRYEKTGPTEYTFYAQMPYAVYVEFGTGPKGRATGAVPQFPDDPQDRIFYHTGEVIVVRYRGRLLESPVIRYTQGMEARPFIRPALIIAVEQLRNLLKKYSGN